MNAGRYFFAALAGILSSISFAENTHTLIVDGRERSYYVHVPTGLEDASERLPVVLAFHGGAGNGRQFMRYSGLVEKADEAGFIAVFPNGTGRLKKVLTWNGGDCCGYAERADVDDVAFVAALLDDLTVRYSVDSQRVYATGMSNGAMISFRLAAELGERIAAVAPVGAAMVMAPEASARPVPIIYFHGTADKNAPFAGGKGQGLSGFSFPGAEDAVAAWVEVNGCSAEFTETALPDTADDRTSVTLRLYDDCEGGAEIAFYIVEGGGHTWPGRPGRIPKLGAATHDISANDLMWEFFERHTLPE